jgi:Domain of unknown function (DUF3552).
MSTVLIAVLAALAVGLGVYVAFLRSGKKSTLDKARDDARVEAEKAAEILQSSRKEAANILKEAALQAKDHLLQVKIDFEKETRDRKNELSQLEKRLLQKEDQLDRKNEQVEARGTEYTKKEREIAEQGRKLEAAQADLDSRLAAPGSSSSGWRAFRPSRRRRRSWS